VEKLAAADAERPSAWRSVGVWMPGQGGEDEPVCVWKSVAGASGSSGQLPESTLDLEQFRSLARVVAALDRERGIGHWIVNDCCQFEDGLGEFEADLRCQRR
jgi:hypothetical protein